MAGNALEIIYFTNEEIKIKINKMACLNSYG